MKPAGGKTTSPLMSSHNPILQIQITIDPQLQKNRQFESISNKIIYRVKSKSH